MSSKFHHHCTDVIAWLLIESLNVGAAKRPSSEIFYRHDHGLQNASSSRGKNFCGWSLCTLNLAQSQFLAIGITSDS